MRTITATFTRLHSFGMSAASCLTKQVFDLSTAHRRIRRFGFRRVGLPLFQEPPKTAWYFNLVFGKGISNYYNDNFGLGTDVGFDADGHLVATPTGSGQCRVHTQLDEDPPQQR